ncbi:pyridoxal-phosphate dependent enzyme [Pseudomonas sp. NFXW11]|uniref:threonine ammonia-lyase n=1 Tax=Pseudomonas sp. NFXW11 TaxID=2819531 RepID=UPI003CF2CD66
MTDLIDVQSIVAAAQRIAGAVLRTPSVASPVLAERVQRPVFLKLENLQVGGSFKARGVLNKFSMLKDDLPGARFVAVSGGNFGIAVAEAAKRFGAEVTLIVPQSAPSSSVQRMRGAGATVLVEDDVYSAFARAKALEAEGYRVLDDCADTLIAEGHGTLALEFIADCPTLTDVFVAVGGGAMLAGVATALKAVKPDIRIWGVETHGASSMSQALQAGRPVEAQISSVISTLGVPMIHPLMLGHAQQYVQGMLLVSDQEAIQGMRALGEDAGLWVELASGTLLPALLAHASKLPEEAVVGLVVCGGNLSAEDMGRCLEQVRH